MNSWARYAISQIEADFNRSSDTHLIKIDLPNSHYVDLYLKDESTHSTGSLKHRLARSLFLYGICNGNINENTTIIEASSGSTAISEAYFAQLLGLPFIAVVPHNISQEKIDAIAFYDGKCHFVEPPNIYQVAEDLATECSGHYMDQFTYAERATDWRGNNNIAESMFAQMSAEPHPIPTYVVMSAGTGGTSATIGRYIKYKGYDTKVCVVDPEHSVFYDYYQTGDSAITCARGSTIEGIGRPRVEPSFITSVIDEMMQIPDAASFATIHFLEGILNRKVGGSTGTNVYGAFQIISHLNAQQRHSSIVSIICDSGERYLDTYYNKDWLSHRGIDTSIYMQQLETFYATGIMLTL